MKICEIIPDLEKRAGAEVFFHSLVKKLASDSSLQIIVILIWDLIDESFIDLINNPRIKFYCCNKHKTGISFKSVRYFKKILNLEKPDVIHTHRSVTLTYFLAFGFKKKRWRYFHTVHNIASKEAKKYEVTLRRLYLKKGIINHIGISDIVSNTIEEVYGLLPVATIYNGIEIIKYDYAEEKQYDFICVARFSKQKNHALLIEAFNSYLKKHPDSKLLLVGDGELIEECKDQVRKLQISKNIIFLGHTESAVNLMNKSKCFVLSSIYEGNPISILEAMSVGIPIIAPSVGGIPDVIKNGRNGLLFEPNNVGQLLYSMFRITDDKALNKRIIGNNLNDIKRYSISSCAKEYIGVFKNNL